MAIPIYASVITGFERVACNEVQTAFKVPCKAERGNVRFNMDEAKILEVRRSLIFITYSRFLN